MMKKIATIVASLSLFAASALAIDESSAKAQTRKGFRIIVNSSNTAVAIKKNFLADVYFKKVTKWSNGHAVRPIDMVTKSEIRQYFCEVVMNRSSKQVRNYWTQQIFSGRNIPPPEAGTEQDVLSYVSRRPGAVGYVSVRTNIKNIKNIKFVRVE